MSAFAAAVLYAQGASVPASWKGTWKLNVSKSKIAPLVAPGLPEGLTVVSQTLKIEEAAGRLRILAETELSDPKYSAKDEVLAGLNGEQTSPVPGVMISVSGLNDSSFDILVKMNDVFSTNRFEFSKDGKTLTETKSRSDTQTTSVLVLTRD